MNLPTEKQLNFIKQIEVYCDKFTGSTKEDASKYISDNIELFKVREANDHPSFESEWALIHGYY